MLDNMKESCQYVMNQNQHVKINYDKLDEFIKNIDYDKLKNWLLYNPYNLLELDIEMIIFIFFAIEAMICYMSMTKLMVK